MADSAKKPNKQFIINELLDALEEVENAGCLPESETPCCPYCQKAYPDSNGHEAGCKVYGAIRLAKTYGK